MKKKPFVKNNKLYLGGKKQKGGFIGGGGGGGRTRSCYSAFD